MSYGQEEICEKDQVGREAEGEEEVGRDGEQFRVGPINVSRQQEQPAPGNVGN